MNSTLGVFGNVSEAKIDEKSVAQKIYFFSRSCLEKRALSFGGTLVKNRPLLNAVLKMSKQMSKYFDICILYKKEQFTAQTNTKQGS